MSCALGALYAFLIGLGAMSASLRVMNQGYDALIVAYQAGPFVSLCIGMLATAIFQSSSSTTSILVGFVAAGAVSPDAAVYMVMGANMGTTVTSTLISLGHLRRANEYRRAFSAATAHVLFNAMAIALLFPLQRITGCLDFAAEEATEVFRGLGATELVNPIKALTEPILERLLDGAPAHGPTPLVMLVGSIALIFGSIAVLIRLLRALIVSRFENLFDQVLFSTPARSFAIGIFLTALVQSSSITTSLAVPLVGAGVLTLTQAFPYLMGANVGTTITSVLAALAFLAGARSDSEVALGMAGLTLAFYHVSFNVLGVLMIAPFRSVPIRTAELFADFSARHRWVPFAYIAALFFALPLVVILIGVES